MRAWALSLFDVLLFYALGVLLMSRTIQQQLVEKGLAKESKEKQQQKHKEKKKIKLSKREIEELMGIRRPTYRRNRGAIRQS